MTDPSGTSSLVRRSMAFGVLVTGLVGLLVLGGTDWSGLYAVESVPNEPGGERGETSEGSTTTALEQLGVAGVSDVLRGDPGNREPWEVQYMYGVSLGAAVWVALRLLAHWRIDFRTLALEPRERPLPLFERTRESRIDPGTEPSDDGP